MVSEGYSYLTLPCRFIWGNFMTLWGSRSKTRWIWYHNAVSMFVFKWAFYLTLNNYHKYLIITIIRYKGADPHKWWKVYETKICQLVHYICWFVSNVNNGHLLYITTEITTLELRLVPYRTISPRGTSPTKCRCIYYLTSNLKITVKTLF